MACSWHIPVAEVQVDHLSIAKHEKAELGILEEMLCNSLYMQTSRHRRVTQSRHRRLSPPVWTISRGKPFQRLATLNFFLPLFLLFIYSFVISENTESTKYISDVGRCETKRRTANCRAGKVHSSFCACQDRANFSLYSCSSISVDTQFTASKALWFCLISSLSAWNPPVAGWFRKRDGRESQRNDLEDSSVLQAHGFKLAVDAQSIQW